MCSNPPWRVFPDEKEVQLRKIFTKKLDFSKVTQAAVSSETYDARTAWLAQEDIEIIGCEVHADCVSQVGNDGMAFGIVEVSNSGKYGQEGCFARSAGIAEWNTTPGFGGNRQPNCVVVMFPAGYAITVKEEGYVYLNGYVNAAELTAGDFEFAGSAILYYVKKGS